MGDEDLKNRVMELEDRLGILEDVHAIRRLHHLYGYFLDKCMYDEVVDCYADDCEFYFFGGVFKGKAGIREVIFEDMLREGTDYYGFGEFLKFQKTFPIQLRQFLKRMERKNVTEHILFKEGQKVLVTRKHSRVRYIPQEMDFPSSIFMYGKTKVATVIWSDPPITILVKNKDVHDSYMSYFKLLWKMAKK